MRQHVSIHLMHSHQRNQFDNNNNNNWRIGAVVHLDYNILISFVENLSDMADTPEIPTELPTAAQDEPFLGTIDIVLLIALAIGAVYYLIKRSTKEEKPAPRTYSIQWVFFFM